MATIKIDISLTDTEDYSGGCKAIYEELHKAGIALSHSGTYSINAVTMKIAGFDGDVTVNFNGSRANIAVGNKTTNAISSTTPQVFYLYFQKQTTADAAERSWFVVYSGSPEGAGCFGYFGCTDSGEHVAFGSANTNITVFFPDDLSAANGNLIMSQMPVMISSKWAKRKLYITDNAYNILQTTNGESSENSYAMGVSNAATTYISGLIDAANNAIYGATVDSNILASWLIEYDVAYTGKTPD